MEKIGKMAFTRKWITDKEKIKHGNAHSLGGLRNLVAVSVSFRQASKWYPLNSTGIHIIKIELCHDRLTFYTIPFSSVFILTRHMMEKQVACTTRIKGNVLVGIKSISDMFYYFFLEQSRHFVHAGVSSPLISPLFEAHGWFFDDIGEM